MDKITGAVLETSKETTGAVVNEKIFLSKIVVKRKLELDMKSLDMEIKLLFDLLREINKGSYSSVSEIYKWLSFINPLLAESVTSLGCLKGKLREERSIEAGLLDDGSTRKIVRIIKAGINSAKDLLVKTQSSLNAL